jgi:hypothetical protein
MTQVSFWLCMSRHAVFDWAGFYFELIRYYLMFRLVMLYDYQLIAWRIHTPFIILMSHYTVYVIREII